MSTDLIIKTVVAAVPLQGKSPKAMIDCGMKYLILTHPLYVAGDFGD